MRQFIGAQIEKYGIKFRQTEKVCCGCRRIQKFISHLALIWIVNQSWFLILLTLCTIGLAGRTIQSFSQWSEKVQDRQPASDCHQSAGEQATILRSVEKNKYLVRRVEFSGNAKTRDSVLRRNMALREGNVFTRSVLTKSLASLTKLKQIYPVTLGDVVAHLDDEAKAIDILICFEERNPYPSE
jgi:Surface antigen variable number repeat